jgi:hypothetical protein
VAAPAVARGQGEHRGGVEPTGEQHDRGAAAAGRAQRRSVARRVRALPAASEPG